MLGYRRIVRLCQFHSYMALHYQLVKLYVHISNTCYSLSVLIVIIHSSIDSPLSKTYPLYLDI